jgi:hypothetical protein
MTDRRRAVRTPSNLPSYVRDWETGSYIDCTVLDISETGARIAVAHPVAASSLIEVHIPAKGQVIEASVVWSANGEIGTRFERAYPPEERAAALLRFAAQLR